MAKVRLNPLFEELRGKITGMVFRLSHNGKISAYMSPDMTRVRWSPAQVAQRERFAEASAYASAVLSDPQIRPIYERRSMEKRGNKRPYDWALADYMDGNNLLGERFHWDVEIWRARQHYRRRKRR
jgi:hypothetical protein